MSKPDLRIIPLSRIQERPGDNPNVMDPTKYAQLVHNIRTLGFWQPLTVRLLQATPTLFEIVDGHHRFRAAGEAGLKQVPALVVEADEPHAAAGSLSLNRLRGEVDLGKAAAMLRELAETGFPDLTLTGFNGGDIQELLKSPAMPSALDDLGAGAGGGEDVEGETSVGTRKYTVRLSFDRAEDRDSVRAAALAHGATVEAGLLAIIKGVKP